MAKIEKWQLEPLWNNGVPLSVIAQSFKCSESWVSQCANRFGFERRGKNGVAKSAAEIDEAMPKLRRDRPERPGWTLEMDLHLALTRGSYKRLAALARQWGMTLRQVQFRYHAVAK